MKCKNHFTNKKNPLHIVLLGELLTRAYKCGHEGGKCNFISNHIVSFIEKVLVPRTLIKHDKLKNRQKVSQGRKSFFLRWEPK